MRGLIIVLSICLGMMTVNVFAARDSLVVNVHSVQKSGQGASIGTVTFKETTYGLLIEPHLHGLDPGMHGFHIHQKPNCSNFGKAAGPHFDPAQTNKHLGPYNKAGHLGDLPVLFVNNKGIANTVTLAPRFTLGDLKGHALMVHRDGDNYSDQPKANGGGGARIDCGIIK